MNILIKPSPYLWDSFQKDTIDDEIAYMLEDGFEVNEIYGYLLAMSISLSEFISDEHYDRLYDAMDRLLGFSNSSVYGKVWDKSEVVLPEEVSYSGFDDDVDSMMVEKYPFTDRNAFNALPATGVRSVSGS